MQLAHGASDAPLFVGGRVLCCSLAPRQPAPPLQQIAKLREEEAREDAWFILPPAEDEDVNWLAFSVEIEGPVRCGVAVAQFPSCTCCCMA